MRVPRHVHVVLATVDNKHSVEMEVKGVYYSRRKAERHQEGLRNDEYYQLPGAYISCLKLRVKDSKCLDESNTARKWNKVDKLLNALYETLG